MVGFDSLSWPKSKRSDDPKTSIRETIPVGVVETGPSALLMPLIHFTGHEKEAVKLFLIFVQSKRQAATKHTMLLQYTIISSSFVLSCCHYYYCSP